MKKLFTIIAALLVLSGCASTEFQPTSQMNDQSNQTVPNPNQEKKAVSYTTNYLPEGWIIEDNTYYSPEMYNTREGGPYSLHVTLNDKFSSIDNYLKSKNNCIENKTELTINNYQAVQFTDLCAYANPKMTIIEMKGNLVEAFSYSFFDEFNEIKKVLSSLELTE